MALHRYRFLLRALALGSSAVEPRELDGIAREAYRSMVTWLLSNAGFIVGLSLFARPDFLDPATTLGVALLALLVVSAAALPLYSALRAVSGVLELAPLSVMAELVGAAERSRQATLNIRNRLIIAVVAPVGFVTLG